MADEFREAIRKRQQEREKRRETQEKDAKVKLKKADKLKLKKKPVQDLSANPPARRPTPMIRPGAGPVAQLSSQAAHTHGFTPKAYDELRRIPTGIVPSREADEEDVIGRYREVRPARNGFPPQQESITLYGNPREVSPDTLAHEQSHGYWWRHGLQEDQPNRQFKEDFENWAEQPGDNPAKRTMEFFGDTGMDEDYFDPYRQTENYARSLDQWPTADHSNFPDQMRPYYRGLLQGMDRQQDGSPTPPLFQPANRRWR